MLEKNLDLLSPRDYIIIKGAAVHNLKKVDVAIPHGHLTVITGLSGSGKSSLAFDTLYAEGQRRYVESLSSYARQFLGRLDKPEMEYIKGVSPAVAIEQKVISRNPRSTVGTTTEIYDYLKVLFARIGKTYHPQTGQEVKRHTVADVLAYMNDLPEGHRILIECPLLLRGRALDDQLKVLEQQGYARIAVGGEVIRIDQAAGKNLAKEKESLTIVIDRVKHQSLEDDAYRNRLADSIETAFFEGHGVCLIRDLDQPSQQEFSNLFEADGITFEEPSVHLFSFNNPFGACPKCEGMATILGVDEDLVVPDSSLSVYEDAIVAWKGEKMATWKKQVLENAEQAGFPIHKPYFELSKAEKQMLWKGTEHFHGLHEFFRFLESKSYKIQYRVMLSRFRGKAICDACDGKRLRQEAGYVKIGSQAITDLVELPVERLYEHMQHLPLSEHEQKIAKRLLTEINSRLHYLCEVGLGYLTLNRMSNTLSGGESQRINLATSLGSALVGSTYILDEPSIGLHPRDTHRLIEVLLKLRDLGNTVVVVEHDEEIMRAADHIIDMGPEAGSQGGQLVYSGHPSEFMQQEEGYTARYLTGKDQIPLPTQQRSLRSFIEIWGARENNLKNIDVRFPLHAFTVITGVSGSGKSSLVRKIIYPALAKRLGGYADKTGHFGRLSGAIEKLSGVEFVDQNPIGKSSRSNPVTYLKVYDDIRNLFASQPLAKARRYKSGLFSFNIEGGRCEKCQGEGEVTIEMQFMADVHLVCEECKGQRFKNEILDIRFGEKNIHDILQLTVSDAIAFFMEQEQAKIAQKLQPLADVGLGYITLGQSSSTLSGGEAQRVKLATFLGKGESDQPRLFIFDEPTTGLHFADIKKLLQSFYALMANGHSLMVVEHHPDVIKCADWLIDLGPEGGETGGQLVYQGETAGLLAVEQSYTARYLQEKLNPVNNEA